jgi:hypothetical protein
MLEQPGYFHDFIGHSRLFSDVNLHRPYSAVERVSQNQSYTGVLQTTSNGKMVGMPEVISILTFQMTQSLLKFNAFAAVPLFYKKALET